MSYDRNITRGRGRGRGGFNESEARTFSKYEDQSPKDDFPERSFRGSRRPTGNYPRNYSREEYRPREERHNSRDSYERDSYRPREGRRDMYDGYRDREQNFGSRRSPPDYRKDLHRSRPLSPPRKEYHARDMDPGIRDFQARSRNFDNQHDYSPVARDRRMSPVRYNRDGYDPSLRSQRNYEREPYTDRSRRNDFSGSNPRVARDYRSRSPVVRPRGGRFIGQRGGGRGRDNFNRFEFDHST